MKQQRMLQADGAETNPGTALFPRGYIFHQQYYQTHPDILHERNLLRRSKKVVEK